MQKRKFNGRSITAKTKALYQERIRDFNSDRTVTKEDRDAWNRVLAQAGRDDYADWVRRWVDTIEQADEIGDTKGIYAALAGLSADYYSNKQPTEQGGNTINSAEELVELWRQFLSGKFDTTELERARQDLEDLGAPTGTDEDDFNLNDFHAAVHRLKAGKAAGPDGVTAEVWAHSTLAQSVRDVLHSAGGMAARVYPPDARTGYIRDDT